MAKGPQGGDATAGSAPDARPSLPSYEELARDLLEALDGAGLVIEDARNQLEPEIGERRFEVTVRLAAAEVGSRYHAHLSFSWDALLTHLSTYGAGSECELYHEEDEEIDCPHQHLAPQPFVEVEAEFALGDGGYELHDVDEVASWVDTVQALLGKAFPDDDRPSVHIGIAALGSVMLVEKLTAEHSWVVDFDGEPNYAGIARQVQAALRVVPQLADRLPV
ncbi:MAG: hypothetical protein NVSMB29_09240 [Candidatus Dormibacteria bacterium]